MGIVLTPPHITELFCELAQVNENSIVLDSCAGTGGFLISAMHEMLKDASGSNDREIQIKAKQIIGIEWQHDIFTLLCCNMYIHEDGRSNLIKGNCFDEKVKEQVKQFKPNVGFLNPPYKKSDSNDPEELEFILNNLSFLEKGSYCIAIIPMSVALTNTGNILSLKQKILQEHTLCAVLSMPNELFKNSKVGTNTCIMIFKAKEKHKENFKTWFAYCKDDGFTNRKTQGRADYDKKWEKEIKNKWVSAFKNKDEITDFSIKKEVKAENEWCIEAYMKKDNSYKTINKSNFENALKNQLLFLFSKKYIQEIVNNSVLNKNIELNVNEWKEFCINDFFTFKKGKRITKLFASRNVGNIPVIGGGAENHGVMCYLKEEFKNKYVFQEKCFTVSAYGSAGSVSYHNYKCFIDDKSLSFVPKQNLSIYACIFLEVLLNLEKDKYSYGRGVIEDRYREPIIKLPVNSKGEPDWQYMKNYIKSLSYSKNLE